MPEFVLRVIAHYGSPVLVGNIPVRPGISFDFPVSDRELVNDPSTELSLDELLENFQQEYRCKVNYSPDSPVSMDGLPVFEFDVFEPTWPVLAMAQDVIEKLQERLIGWIRGNSPIADTYDRATDDPRVPRTGT